MRIQNVMAAIALSCTASAAQALCAAPEIEAGRYVNVDADTRSITTATVEFVCAATRIDNGDGTMTIRHDADPHWRVALWGSCSPRDCEWGAVRGEAMRGGAIEATYDQGFADRQVRIVPRGDDILVEVRSTYDDGRAARVSRDVLRSAAAPPRPVREDCIAHDVDRLVVRDVGGDTKITDGSHWLMSFGRDRREAQQALEVLQTYGTTHVCYVGRPDPSLSYVLASGSAPTGAMRGEDCIRHDLDALRVTDEGARYLLTDGRSRMVTFDDRTEADAALDVMRRHSFTHVCYVGRPDPSFVYMRR